MGEALAVLEDAPGRVRVVTPESIAAVLEKRDALVAVGDNLGVFLLDSRYLRLHLESPARFTIPAPMAVHLGGVQAGDALYVVRFPDEIEVWTARYRRQMQKGEARKFDGLP
jgi:hypothetical protein